MADITENLGLLMGQSPDEAASDAAWVEAAELAFGEAAQAENGSEAMIEHQSGADLAETTAPETTDGAVDISAELDVSGVDASEAAGFPFETAELISLLPHSVAGRAEEIWGFAYQLTGQSNTFTVALAGIGAAFLLTVLFSAARVWKREEEFAVSGFGDQTVRPGAGYTLRQDPVMTDAPGPVAKRVLKADKKSELGAASTDQLPQFLRARANAFRATSSSEGESAAGSTGPKRVRRQLKVKSDRFEAPQADQNQPTQTQPAEKQAPDGTTDQASKPPATVSAIRRARRQAMRANPVTKSAANNRGQTQSAKASFAPTPVNPAAPAQPKTKSAKLANATTPRPQSKAPTSVATPGAADGRAPLAASFHGAYGSFHDGDRKFAADYLAEIIANAEKVHLTAGGPKFGRKMAGESKNVSAERLFMVATQTSVQDPQSALAALWQAADENPNDGVAWLRLANFYLEFGDPETAEKILRPFLKLAETQRLALVAAAAANSLGRISASRDDVDMAQVHFSKAYRYSEAAGRPYMRGVAVSNLGVLDASRGALKDACNHLNLGIESFQQCNEAVASARTKVVLGAVYMAMGDKAHADNVWGEARSIFDAESLAEEAAIVGRWEAGEAPPSGVSL